MALHTPARRRGYTPPVDDDDDVRVDLRPATKSGGWKPTAGWMGKAASPAKSRKKAAKTTAAPTPVRERPVFTRTTDPALAAAKAGVSRSTAHDDVDWDAVGDDDVNDTVTVGAADVGDDEADEAVVEAAPASAPAPAVASFGSPVPERGQGAMAAVSVRPITYGDIDQLWDWLRQDRTQAQAFFEQVPASSHQLNQWMLTHAQRDAQSIQAIVVGSELFGFVLALTTDNGPLVNVRFFTRAAYGAFVRPVLATLITQRSGAQLAVSVAPTSPFISTLADMGYTPLLIFVQPRS